MSKILRIGLIGCGSVGQMHLHHWSHLEGCRVVAVSDLRSELLNLVADQHRIPERYATHSDLLRNADVDAVLVVTHRNNNASVTYDCLQAGKHVFSEKPIAKTIEQAHKLAQAAVANQVVFAVGYQRRHDAGTKIAKQCFEQLMSSGEIGRLVSVRGWNFTGHDRDQAPYMVMTRESRPSGPAWETAPSWLDSKYHESYDKFLNVYSHDLNMIRSWFGEFPEVEFADLERLEAQTILLRWSKVVSAFQGGQSTRAGVADDRRWYEGLEFFFEGGRLLVEFSAPLKHSLCSRVELVKGPAQQLISEGTTDKSAFALQAESFRDAILSGSQPPVSGLDAVHDLELAEAIWRCYTSNASQALLANCSV